MINLTVGHSDWFLNEQKTNSSSCVAVGLAYIIVQTIYFLRGQSDGEHHIWSTIDVVQGERFLISWSMKIYPLKNSSHMHKMEIKCMLLKFLH